MTIVGFFQWHESKPKTFSRELYGNRLILYSRSTETLNYLYSTKSFLYILNSFTEVDILCFGCMELKKISFDFHKKESKSRLVTLKKILIPRYLLH